VSNTVNVGQEDRVHVYLRSGYKIYGSQARVSIVVRAGFLKRTG